MEFRIPRQSKGNSESWTRMRGNPSPGAERGETPFPDLSEGNPGLGAMRGKTDIRCRARANPSGRAERGENRFLQSKGKCESWTRARENTHPAVVQVEFQDPEQSLRQERRKARIPEQCKWNPKSWSSAKGILNPGEERVEFRIPEQIEGKPENRSSASGIP
ncbi:hypothetical protein chiPu_0016465, partial [Chiloscyllium punctatum]|nr:hypothetical protein [Chiloscyllium punctatum]